MQYQTFSLSRKLFICFFSIFFFIQFAFSQTSPAVSGSIVGESIKNKFIRNSIIAETDQFGAAVEFTYVAGGTKWYFTKKSITGLTIASTRNINTNLSINPLADSIVPVATEYESFNISFVDSQEQLLEAQNIYPSGPRDPLSIHFHYSSTSIENVPAYKEAIIYEDLGQTAADLKISFVDGKLRFEVFSEPGFNPLGNLNFQVLAAGDVIVESLTNDVVVLDSEDKEIFRMLANPQDHTHSQVLFVSQEDEFGNITQTPLEYSLTGRKSNIVNLVAPASFTHDPNLKTYVDPYLHLAVIGGINEDGLVALDSKPNLGSAVAVGWTGSAPFPLPFPGALFSTPGRLTIPGTGGPGGASEAVIAVLFDKANVNAKAVAVIGGGGSQRPNDVYVDSDGLVAITGYTGSANFPITPDALQTTHGGGLNDSFVMLIDKNLRRILNSTFYGGNERDNSFSLITNKNHTYGPGIVEVWFAGSTRSAGPPSAFPAGASVYSFPNGGSLNGLVDAYLAGFRADISGSTPMSSITAANLGGAMGGVLNQTDIQSLTFYDDILCGAGTTYATDLISHTYGGTLPSFPAQPFDLSHGGSGAPDAYVICLDTKNPTPPLMTYIGTSSLDAVYGDIIDMDQDGVLVGLTSTHPTSALPTSAGAWMPNPPATIPPGYPNGYFIELDRNLSSMRQASFVGSDHQDLLSTVQILNSRTDKYILLSGQTRNPIIRASSFPLIPSAGGFLPQTYHAGGDDLFNTILKANVGQAMQPEGSFLNGGGMSESSNAYLEFSPSFSTATTPVLIGFKLINAIETREAASWFGFPIVLPPSPIPGATDGMLLIADFN